MEHNIVCACGKTMEVSEGMAGSAIPCTCGNMVQVPSLSQLRGPKISESMTPPTPLHLPDNTTPSANPIGEISRPGA